MAKRKRSRHIPKDPFLAPDGTLVVPVSEELSGLATFGNLSLAGLKDGTISPTEFMRSTATLSDRELNFLIYQHAKVAVDNGYNKPWPEDDFGILMWFQMDFITPEMRETFPAIAREYLANEPMIGQDFNDIPVPRMNESTWDDAYNYRVLAIMVMAARRGSSYSRNFLIALYKVYYKSEYNRIRKLSKLTLIDLLEIFDEDCKRRGYPSGHSTGEFKSYGQYIIEKREHEAGWTNASGTRVIFGKPSKSPMETELESSLNTFSELYDQPDEPPMPPVSARLFIMCEMMHIEIDATCNQQAWEINESLGSITKLIFHNGTEMRHFRQILVDRNHDFLTTQYPEVTDPFIYQKDARYFPLEVAEQVMMAAFKKYDRNIRLPYDSRQFRLDELLSEIGLSIHMAFPGLQFTHDQAQMLAMIHYLSECLCDLMIARDREIDSLLHFRARLNEGELDVSEKSDEWIIKTVEKLRSSAGKNGLPSDAFTTDSKSSGSDDSGKDHNDQKPVSIMQERPVSEPITIDELKRQLVEKDALLNEKETLLAEAQQKVIRQRFLYEQARDKCQDLEQLVADREDEHTELIALREFVHGLENEDVEIDEADQETMISALQDKKVAVLGGLERWVKKMKRMFPKWVFISADDSVGGVNALEGADYVYIYSNALQHKQYYKAMNLIRKQNKVLFYLNGTNTSENIVKMYGDLCK